MSNTEETEEYFEGLSQFDNNLDLILTQVTKRFFCNERIPRTTLVSRLVTDKRDKEFRKQIEYYLDYLVDINRLGKEDDCYYLINR